MKPKLAALLLLTALAASAQLKNATYAPGQLAHVPGEPVIVNKFGVYPLKIVRSEGPFLLYIENRLPGHTDHYSVTLDQANAAELVGLDTTAAKFNASALLDLDPGTYLVRFRVRTELSFTIQISAGSGAAQ
ncbi:MAG TPA: hypothetical protein VN924_05210 [Bryobacteraceae bacterium]|nr:hypothetical protein [Bryobacteraceae bacterium]